MNSSSRLSTIEIGDTWFTESAGGLARVFHQLLKHFESQNIVASGLVAGSSELERKTNDASIRVFSEPRAPLLKRLASCRRQFIRLAEEKKPDLVSAHFALYAAPVLDLLGDRPFVMHFHGPWAAESAVGAQGLKDSAMVLAKKRLERYVYARADCVIVLSNYFGSLAQKEYGVRPERIKVIPGGVDARFFDIPQDQKQAREALGWDLHKPTVVVVRRLAKRMGLENLIEAMALLTASGSNVVVKIAGRGPHQTTLQRLIEKLGLTQQIEMLGFVADSDLPLIYRAGDISVVPSTSLEGFGLTTLESFAAGTPALVTPVAGLPEAVGNLSQFLVMRGHDAKSIAQGIEDALSGVLPLPTAPECIEYARLQDWEIITKRTAAIYREVLHRHSDGI